MILIRCYYKSSKCPVHYFRIFAEYFYVFPKKIPDFFYRKECPENWEFQQKTEFFLVLAFVGLSPGFINLHNLFYAMKWSLIWSFVNPCWQTLDRFWRYSVDLLSLSFWLSYILIKLEKVVITKRWMTERKKEKQRKIEN